MPESLKITLNGNFADQHMMPLYEGGETLAGTGLLFTRTAHYLLNGDVRRKAPYDHRLKILTRNPSPGSVELDFIGFLLAPAPVTTIGAVTISVSANLIFHFGIYLFKKLTSSQPAKVPDQLNEIAKQRPGDVDALAAAVTSPAKRAHSVINQGAFSVNINGDGNTVILNPDTKKYISTTLEKEELHWLNASIAWLNANQRTGGAFVFEYGRVIPFEITKGISDKSLQAITNSFSNYMMEKKDEAVIAIRVTERVAVDGTIKSFRLFEATDVSQ